MASWALLRLMGAPDRTYNRFETSSASTPSPKIRSLVPDLAGILAVLNGVGDVTKAIAGGHALVKHLAEFAEFGVKDEQGLAKIVEEVMTSPASETKALSGGRTVYYDSERNIVVFHDPSSPDKGTVFRPTEGSAYFNRQK